MNKIFLVGRLTRDPEMEFVGDKKRARTRLTLAVDRSYKNSQGEREVDFIPIVMWGRAAEVAAKYLTKGQQISLVGSIRVNIYDDSEGRRRYFTAVVADTFEFLGSNKDSMTLNRAESFGK